MTFGTYQYEQQDEWHCERCQSLSPFSNRVAEPSLVEQVRFELELNVATRLCICAWTSVAAERSTITVR
jgi:hypothetical protein